MFKITTKEAYETCWCLGGELPIDSESFEYEDPRVKQIALELHIAKTEIMQLKFELREIYLSKNN